MDIGRIPPHDVDAEQAILGSMLTDKDAVIAALEILKEDAFYREDNKIIFRAITNLYLRNEPIDIITVKAELVEMGDLEKAGGIEYLAELPLKVPTTANIERYVKIVEEKYILRNLISTSNELIALGYDETEEVDSIMDVAERRIFDLAQKKNSKGYTSMKDVLVNSFVELEKLYNMKGNIAGIPTGFNDLDVKLAGLHNSDLIILAARPAMGKSAFAINIAANVAVQSNVPVAIFNLEMSKEQIGNRILCSEAMVDSNKIRTGQIDDEDWVKLAGTIGRLSDAPIYIDDTPGITITEIRAKCRKLKLEKEIGLVVIDYLQLIAGTGKAGSREQEISEISRSLKILAKELEIPVIAISQLSRGAEKREDKRPMLSDLRESGAIEQDADIVMFLYRDDYYNEDSEKKNVAEVIVAKQRSGSTGTVELAWLPSYTKFGNLDRRYYNQDSGEEG
ncbi:MAG: replicative DNA helicase [Clostridia bacterium]|nr:replicative DNA helicase [Clostridia bacterium]